MILGIDIGATKTRLGYWQGERLEKSGKIPTSADPASFLEDLKHLVADFLGPDRDRLEGIGIGAPGPLDPKRGVFRRLPNLPQWDGFELGNLLSSSYRIPVRMQNDANVAALGEAIHGGGRGRASVYYITISTGIGGGFVLDNRIVSGAHYLTGELWTLPVLSFGRPEILLNSSSGPGIVRTARMLLDQGQPSSLGALESFDTADVFEQAEQGDDLCRKVMENAARCLAAAVVSVLVVVDPDIILIGGGMAGNDDCLINPIRKAVAETAYLEEQRRTPVCRAELWDEAVLYGAISLVDA
jgi:predicted NBD/HSP70 family sugar kinase